MPVRRAARLLDLVLPPSCAVCGVPGAPACAACLSRLEALGPPSCARCGHPQNVPVPTCPECRGRIDAARQACSYDAVAAALVGALKDGRRRDLAPVLARVVTARCPLPAADAVLVPVPLTPRRLRGRGFNQSLLIARALARAWGLPLRDDVLVRVRDEGHQRGASRSVRGRQAAGAFAGVDGRAAPACCCLVDDVHTTGATLAACAAALRRAGARRVEAVAFARAVRA